MEFPRENLKLDVVDDGKIVVLASGGIGWHSETAPLSISKWPPGGNALECPQAHMGVIREPK